MKEVPLTVPLRLPIKMKVYAGRKKGQLSAEEIFIKITLVNSDKIYSSTREDKDMAYFMGQVIGFGLFIFIIYCLLS